MKKLLFISVLLAFGLTVSSQTQFLAVADGNWNASTTWDQNASPGAADFVKIAGGLVVTLQSSTTAECAIVEVGDVTGNGVLTVHGTLTISETAGLSVAVTHANSQLTVNGTLTYTGNLDIDAGLLIVNGSMEYITPPPPVPTIYNSTTGETWMDRNLGASQVATASDDAAAYGDYYQWGRLTDGHQNAASGTKTTLSSGDVPGHGNFILSPDDPKDWRNPQNDALWQGTSSTNNPCPSGFRLPTDAEWEAERLSWDTQDAAGAFSSLKLTLPGDRNLNTPGNVSGIGVRAHYWSSTIKVTGTGNQSMNLNLGGSWASISEQPRAYGLSVRCIKENTVTDIDGNQYGTVKIGSQIWMKENLKTTKLNDGTTITNVTDNAAWGALTTPGRCWYDNDEASNGDIYGILYNWYTVETAKLCPAGWHIPSDAEWKILEGNADTQYGVGDPVWDNPDLRGLDVGKRLKKTTGWSTNTGTDVYGYSALPGGIRQVAGGFSSIGVQCSLWSATGTPPTAWRRTINHDSDKTGRYQNSMKIGSSVRCLKD